jgi:hypothetical protein
MSLARKPQTVLLTPNHHGCLLFDAMQCLAKRKLLFSFAHGFYMSWWKHKTHHSVKTPSPSLPFYPQESIPTDGLHGWWLHGITVDMPPSPSVCHRDADKEHTRPSARHMHYGPSPSWSKPIGISQRRRTVSQRLARLDAHPFFSLAFFSESWYSRFVVVHNAAIIRRVKRWRLCCSGSGIC